MSSPFFVKLPRRGAVIIGGEDRKTFLQGLVTNDIALLDRQAIVYSALLTPQGRFLHDFFITEQGDTLHLECEGEDRARDLYDTLKKFKLRSKVDLHCLETIDVFTGTSAPPAAYWLDPRHPALGWRSLNAPTGQTAANFDIWDRHRILLEIPDGSRDMTVDRALALECNLDWLNGVSFSKGCFVGQELTARMHHRTLVKKRLRAVHDPDLSAIDPALGEIKSVCGDVGIALVRDESLPLLERSENGAYRSVRGQKL